MNLRNKNRTYTRFAAVALCLGGLLAASVTIAGGTNYNGYGYNNDDDDSYGSAYDDDDGYRRGDRYQREPRFYDRGDTLRADIEVRGLRRNRNVRAELEASAEVVIECQSYHNRYGRGDRFRHKLHLEVDGVEYFSRSRIYGNELDIDVETDDIERELRDYYGSDVCPGQALAKVESVQFSDARLEISQSGRRDITWLCSFDYDTRNGPVSRRNVDCVTLY